MKVIKFVQSVNKKQILAFLFTFALVLRIITILVMGQQQNLYENGEIALHLIQGRGFVYSYFPPVTQLQPTCIMAPFYPFFLATFFLLFGVNQTALLAVQLIQVIIGSLTIFPIYYLSRMFFSQRTAVISCMLFAVYPDFLYSVASFHQIVFTTFLIPILIFFTYDLQKKPTHRKAGACGALYGFSLLVEPVIISVFSLMSLWIVISWIRRKSFNAFSSKSLPKSSLKRKVMAISILVVFCGLVILPWEVRCLMVYEGNFVFIKGSGFNLWRGNNAKYTETGIPPWYPSEMVVNTGLTKEGEIERMFYDSARSYISSHILETLFNSLRKMVDFWWFPKILPEQSPPLRRALYAPLLLLAIGALFYERRRIKELMPLLVPFLGFTLLYSITFVLPRYRVPIQPLLFILSAYGLVLILEALKGRFHLKSGKYTNVIRKVDQTDFSRCIG